MGGGGGVGTVGALGGRAQVEKVESVGLEEGEGHILVSTSSI